MNTDKAREALELHVYYESLPADRGGHNGPKGMAWAAFIDARDAALRTPESPEAVAERIEEVCREEGLSGAACGWRSCTGCHESSEGVPQGPYSQTFKTHVGLGCGECGGIGVVWEYWPVEALDAMARDLTTPPEPVADPTPTDADKPVVTEAMDARDVIMAADVEFMHNVPVHPSASGADAILAALTEAGYRIVGPGVAMTPHEILAAESENPCPFGLVRVSPDETTVATAALRKSSANMLSENGANNLAYLVLVALRAAHFDWHAAALRTLQENSDDD